MREYLFPEWVENPINVTSHGTSIHRYESCFNWPRSQYLKAERGQFHFSYQINSERSSSLVGERLRFNAVRLSDSAVTAAVGANTEDVEETRNLTLSSCRGKKNNLHCWMCDQSGALDRANHVIGKHRSI